MISHKAFQNITTLVKVHSGMHLSESKKQLVVGRLSKRLRHLNLPNYDAYYDACMSSTDELQVMINTLTTNETSFFRESHHFEFMRHYILPHAKHSPFRVWSAAASIGAEGYSIAMELDDVLSLRGIEWEVVGTDINTEVIENASQGLFAMRFSEQIPKEYLKRYCLKGVGVHEGEFLIDDYLRKKVNFSCANLMQAISSELGQFDVIFLRNMLIYFDNENRKRIINHVVKALKPNGYLFIGHAESITHLCTKIRQIRPTIYRNGV